jgi:hypothetical protein
LTMIATKNPQGIRSFPNAVQITDAVANALGKVYYFSVTLSAFIFVCAIFIKEFKTDKKKPAATPIEV